MAYSENDKIDYRSEWEKKIYSNIFSEKDTASDEYRLSAEPEPEHLGMEDAEESLEDYYSDYDIEELKSWKETPTVFVFKKNAPSKVDSEDIFSLLENDMPEYDADNFDYEKVDELLKPLNEYLKTAILSFDVVGVLDPKEVKPIWKKILKEWSEEGE